MSERPRVLITNAEERSMLATCRSLHAAGYDVTAASSTRLAAAQWSRSCSRRLQVPDARESSSGFVERLGEELARLSYGTLIAGSDSSLLALSRSRSRVEQLTTLGLPPQPTVEQAMNREFLTRAAERVGMPTAESIACANVEQVLIAARELGFPVVVKSANAAHPAVQAVESVPKGQVVSSIADLSATAAHFGTGMLLQRWVQGDLISCGGVFAGGRLLGVVTSRYRRMWPPASGSVTFSETIAPPPALVDAVRRLMLLVGWDGIFELELIDSGRGEYVPIDFNPRPYGSMALAEAAGVPLAAIWCDWLLGRGAASSSAPRGQTETSLARAGVRYRWEDGDFRHLLSQLRARRYGDTSKPLRPYRRVTHAHFQRADPLPLLARVLYLGRRLVNER